MAIAICWNKKMCKKYTDTPVKDCVKYRDGLVSGHFEYDVGDIQNGYLVNKLRKSIDDATGENGILLFKPSTKWVYKGEILYVHVEDCFPNTTIPKRLKIYYIRTLKDKKRELRSNKPESFAILNYTKKMGKETGHFGRSTCRLVKIQ